MFLLEKFFLWHFKLGLIINGRVYLRRGKLIEVRMWQITFCCNSFPKEKYAKEKLDKQLLREEGGTIMNFRVTLGLSG